MKQERNTHILETRGIGALLLEYSIPAIIGMTLTSLYHIIDSIFIGLGVGPMALAGLAITFPLMNLIMAFCTLIGTGGAAICSIKLGQKNKKEATVVLGNVLSLSIIIGIVAGGLSLVFLNSILRLFGADSESLFYAREFMQIILLGTPILYIMISLNNLMRASGYPVKAMLTSLVTVIANLILAPLFIFQFNWGIKGAAFATVLSQLLGMIWILFHFFQKKSLIHFEKGIYFPRLQTILSIFSIGMAPFLMNVFASVVVIIFNRSLLHHGGNMAIAAFGIINRILTLYVMTVLGLTLGMQPIIGYNYGAGRYDRVKKTLKYGLITGVVITSCGFIICELFPQGITMLFTNDKELMEIANTGLRICALMFPLVGCQIVVTNFFQSIGQARISIFLSLSRQLLYLLPFLLILPHFWGLYGVWSSMPVADLLAFLTAILMLRVYLPKMKNSQNFEENK